MYVLMLFLINFYLEMYIRMLCSTLSILSPPRFYISFTLYTILQILQEAHSLKFLRCPCLNLPIFFSLFLWTSFDYYCIINVYIFKNIMFLLEGCYGRG